MAETLILPEKATRAEIYEAVLPQIEALITGEPDLVANLANISAVLKEAFGFFWVGFYVMKEGELVLGPFQGPLACTRIRMGKGVCGTAAEQQKTVIVPDVDQFPGHIACSSASRSEIVVPMISGGQCTMVLDVDSAELDDFSPIDQQYLEQMMDLVKAQHG